MKASYNQLKKSFNCTLNLLRRISDEHQEIATLICVANNVSLY